MTMVTNTSKLPPETAALWRRCENEPLLAHSYLLGGTALALQIQHRISEDLDFFYPTQKLPLQKLKGFISKLESEGCSLERLIHWPTYDEFQLGGENLYDYHQVWQVNETTKMSFTTFSNDTVKLLNTPTDESHPVIPTIKELFDTKAVLVSQRLKTRDWLDLYILMREHGFTCRDFFAAYAKVGLLERAAEELHKLTQISVPQGDEGYRSLITPPPSIEDMRDFFAAQKQNYPLPLKASET